jgi:hypothetical protein
MTGRISKQLRWEVFSRDKACVLSFLEEGHECRDLWGQRHAPNAFDVLSVEHVKREGSMMGKKAPNDARHLVALDAYTNINVPSKKQREAIREYLDRVAP